MFHSNSEFYFWVKNQVFDTIVTCQFYDFRFPFYYEVKILLLIWLISPVSKGSLGSSIIYRRFVHPNLIVREEEIDRMIQRLQEQGYNTVTKLAVRAFNYVSNMVMQTAIRVSIFWIYMFFIKVCLVCVTFIIYFSARKLSKNNLRPHI